MDSPHETATEDAEIFSLFEEEQRKIAYLNLIQEPISRMSTISAVIKGFAVTVVAGMTVVSYADSDAARMLLMYIPLIGFMSLDVYYLRLERQFRYLYDQVRLGKHEIDYSLDPRPEPGKMSDAGACVRQIVKSPSMYLFYGMMAVLIASMAVARTFS